jgi:hypothetical protein
MTELPRALAPWAEQIGPLFPELALALAPWLQRLDLALGPMRSLASPGDGEPDGFAGLTRRGPYERLLISEWLLATEVPEEFLRRAASGEQAFHELARREPAGDRTCLVLLDLGPSQLGAPRVAHLALLLVLWRRAQLAGADFRWARAQGGQLRDRLDLASFSDLQLGQGASEIDDAGFAAWQDRPEVRQLRGEFWWIGGPQACDRARRAGLPSVEIIDPLEPGQRSLTARVRPPARPPSEVSLPLPPADDCVRLLREPFRRAVKAPAAPIRTPSGRRFATDRRPFFSHSGRRLFVALQSGGVMAYAVPNSPNASPSGTPVEYRASPGERVIAAAWIQNRPQLIVERAGGLCQLDLGRKGGIVAASGELRLPPVDDRIEADRLRQIAAEIEGWKGGARPPRPPAPGFGQLFTLPNSTHRFFLDEHRRFVEFDAVKLESTILQERVVGAVQSYHNAVVAGTEVGEAGPTLQIRVYQGVSKITEAPGRYSIHGDEVFFGLGGLSYQSGPLAFERAPGEWIILTGSPQVEQIHRVPDALAVVGVSAFNDREHPSLLALTDQRRRLVAFREQQAPTELVRLTSPIAQVAVSPSQPMVALLAESGELRIHSLSHSKPVLEVFPADMGST